MRRACLTVLIPAAALAFSCKPSTEADDPCASDSCSGHGTCEAVDGLASCTCDERFVGADCSECAEGWRQVGADCVGDDDPCAPDPCETAGCASGCECDPETGEAVCTCEPDPCASSPCAHGTCSCNRPTGGARCACDEGWAGELCDECDEDYVEDGDLCVPCNLLTFYYSDSAATSVWLTGSFTGWAATVEAGAIEMSNDGAGVWSVTTAITPGGRHTYKFVVDGTRWVPDPVNPDREDDGYGEWNSVIEVCDFGGGGGGECGDLDAFDWRDVVMYFVMVDRFRDSDGNRQTVSGATDGPEDGASGQYMGGDLAGVTERLDYLADLGVTGIWLSAPYENRDLAGAAIEPGRDTHMYSAYHGYWPSPDDIDYSDPSSPSPRPAVESRIGTEDDLRDADRDGAQHHRRQRRGDARPVRLRHESRGRREPASRTTRAGSSTPSTAGSSTARMRPARGRGACQIGVPRDYLWDDELLGHPLRLHRRTCRRSTSRTRSRGPGPWPTPCGGPKEYGIDGYRLDAIKHVPLAWLTDLRDGASSRGSTPASGARSTWSARPSPTTTPGSRGFVDPDDQARRPVRLPVQARVCEAVFSRQHGPRLPVDLDGRQRRLLRHRRGDDARGSATTTSRARSTSRAARSATAARAAVPDNAWTDRLRPARRRGPYERLGLAFAVLLTNPGVPLIYYGDEIGLAGGGDPDNRRMMPWTTAAEHPPAGAPRGRLGPRPRPRRAPRPDPGPTDDPIGGPRHVGLQDGRLRRRGRRRRRGHQPLGLGPVGLDPRGQLHRPPRRRPDLGRLDLPSPLGATSSSARSSIRAHGPASLQPCDVQLQDVAVETRWCPDAPVERAVTAPASGSNCISGERA